MILSYDVGQVTRLCDLTNENDTVTSVSWAERGDKVAVGTHRGFVQVMMIIIILILILKFCHVQHNLLVVDINHSNMMKRNLDCLMKNSFLILYSSL